MKAVLLIAALILIAGCTSQQVVTSTTEGVVINEFSSNPKQIRADETAVFDIDIENIGGTTARNVKAELLGVDRQWRDSAGQPIEGTLEKELPTMRAPDSRSGIPGGSSAAQWEIMPPSIGQGISPTLRVTARVSYDYNTSGFISIPIISDAEFQRMRINSETADSVVVQNSNGPLKMSVARTDAVVIRAEEDSIVPVRIEIQNVGRGFPITSEDRQIGAGGRLRGEILLLGPAEFESCLGESGTRVNLDDSEITARIRDDGKAVVSCSLSLDSSQWEGRAQDTVQLIFNIFYTYYVDESAQVMVVG